MAGSLGTKVVGKIVGGLLVVAAVAFLFFKPSPEPLPEVPSVRPAKTEIVESAGKIAARNFAGRVQAAERVELSFRVSGPLVEMPIRRGQRVEEGELLAQIDPRDFRVRVSRITSRLEEARAQLRAMEIGERDEVLRMRESELAAVKAEFDNAQIELTRYQKLLEEQVISQSEFDQTELRRDQAKEKVGRAQQNLKQAQEGARKEDIEAQEATIRGLEAQEREAKHALDDTSLLSPFKGMVARQHVENFEDVQAGQVVVSLQNVEKVEIVADLPESLLAILHRELVERMVVVFDAVPGRSFDVEFSEIETAADSRTQTFAITVQMSAPDDVNLLPGMPATLQLYLTAAGLENEGTKLVPITAIFSDPEGKAHVWRVDPERLSVHLVPVTLDEPTGDRIGVTEGLDDGDEVVTAGVHHLREGMTIRRIESQR